jgi:hypothetical protein
MRIVNVNALTGADNGSGTGPTLDTKQWVSASFHTYFGDATAAGTVKLQAPTTLTNSGQDFVYAATSTSWYAI